MKRGTTPTLTFTLPFDTEDITKLNLSFSQKGIIVLEKTLSDLTAEDNKITYTMTEAETLALSSGQLKMQLRIGFSNKRMVSQEIVTSVESIIKDGVLA